MAAEDKEGDAKRQRKGTMPAELREKILKSLEMLGEVEAYRRPHRKGAGLVQARCLPPEDLVHTKTGEIRKGQNNRVHFICSNPKCEEPIRNDKWDIHLTRACSDLHLQEAAEEVLERSCNYAPDGEWDNKQDRMCGA